MNDITLKPGDTVYVRSTVGETLSSYRPKGGAYVKVKSSGTPPPEPPPPPPPPTGNIRRVSTSAEFLSAINDMTLDVIELNSGSYDWGYLTPAARTATKPLLVRSVVKWGAIVRTTLAFRNDAAYVTFDGISFEGNSVGDTGIVIFGGYGDGPVHHITMRNIGFRGNTGSAPNSHCFYLSLDRPSDILLEDIVIEGNGQLGLTALHSYHDPNALRVTARRWTVSNVYIGMLLWSDMTGFLAEDWVITGARKAVDIQRVSGTLRRITATGSAMPSTIPSSIAKDQVDLG